MITFVYVLLHIVAAASLFYFCNIIAKSDKKKYWSYAIYPMLVFTFVEGLRWGRGVDWNLYYYEYQYFKYGTQTEFEPLFSLIWDFFAKSELPYWSVISFSSFLFIFSVFYFFKRFKVYLPIALPFYVFFSFTSAENLIRWYTALSFLFIALSLLYEKKYVKCLIMFFCGTMCHYAVVLFLPIYLFLLHRKYCLHFVAVILLDVILIVAFDPQFLGQFAKIFDYAILFTDKFASYSADAEGWLDGSSQSAGTERRLPVVALVTTIPLFIFAGYGYIRAKKNTSWIPLYNFFTLGLFAKAISSGLELASRYSYFFEPFFGLFCAHAIIYMKIKDKKWWEYGFLAISIVYLVYKVFCFCQPTEIENTMLYAWDSFIEPNVMIGYLKQLKN